MSLQELKQKSAGVLSRAINWLVKVFDSEEERERHYCNDIPGLSFVLRSLVDIVWMEFDSCSSRLTECHRANPTDSIKTYLDRVSGIEKINDYLDKYSLLRDEVKVGLTYKSWGKEQLKALLSYPKLFYSCLPCRCPQAIECLYMFKESLYLLDPRFIKNGFMRKLLYHVPKTVKYLEEYFIDIENDEKQLSGWSYTRQNRDTIDAYVTARTLDWIFSWKDEFSELGLREDLSLGSSMFEKCIRTIEKLQDNQDQVRAPRFQYGEKQDVTGSWEEIELGKYSIYRVRAAADIGVILHRIGGSRGTIDKAKTFIDQSFGKSRSVLDSTIFMDLQKSQISDIIGTAGAVRFYLKTQDQESILESPTLSRLEWLVEQVRPEGSWPVLSENLLKQETSKIWLREPLANAVTAREANVSIPNTIIMIDALMSFQKVLAGQ